MVAGRGEKERKTDGAVKDVKMKDKTVEDEGWKRYVMGAKKR